MNLIVYENNSLNENMTKSKEIICPECKEYFDRYKRLSNKFK